MTMCSGVASSRGPAQTSYRKSKFEAKMSAPSDSGSLWLVKLVAGLLNLPDIWPLGNVI